jgi:hypothetical protein
MEKWECELDMYIENCGVYGYPVLDYPENETEDYIDET